MTFEEALIWGSQHLEKVAERPRREAEILLLHLTGKERIWLLTHPEAVLEEEEKYQRLIARRANFEPIEYITQKVSFYSQEFFITQGALIPRPETELLIDEVLKRIPQTSHCTLAEVGVGSGIISIVLAQQLTNARFIATDISSQALEIAQKNTSHKEIDTITFIQSNLLDEVDSEYEVIISNPPYIQEGLVLDPSLSYEPQNALFGGQEGEEILVALIDLALQKRVKYLFCEMGFDQKSKIAAYVNNRATLTFYKDLAGLDRGFIMERKE